MIIIGPNATFGKLFKMVRYGSKTLDSVGNNHNNAATNIPIKVPREKLISISFKVIQTCVNKSLDFHSIIIVSITFLGLEHKKVLISFALASICHILMNSISIKI